ncbi:MAG: hypothetical protein F6K47_40045 [Symploca sp. SIO2E6]|nr:hypothetical protein [Symploca sp. SIO2E6]
MESQENGPLVLGDGFGFFPHGVIDQHFDRKARLGRLIVAVSAADAQQAFGYGIDEDTAFVYDASRDKATVIGAGTVVAVDAAKATFNEVGLQGVRISVLGPGDVLEFPARKVSVNPKKSLITKEYLTLEQTHLSSLFSPYSGRLEEAMGFLLTDNANENALETRVPTISGGERIIRFEQTGDTRGYWGYLDGQLDSYTVLNVSLSITPYR